MTMDPGALGTLMIGLRANEAELAVDDAAPDPERPTAPARRPLRTTLARALRSLADRLEPVRWEPTPAE